MTDSDSEVGEIFRDEHVLVRPHIPGSGKVGLFVGLDPDETTPAITAGDELRDALAEYVGELSPTEAQGHLEGCMTMLAGNDHPDPALRNQLRLAYLAIGGRESEVPWTDVD